MAIQYRLAGTSATLGTALTDDEGDFYFEPAGLAFGANTIETRALQWDDSLGEYLISAWQSFTFDYQQVSTTAAELLDLAVANRLASVSGVPVVSDPTVNGHVKVLDNGALDDVTVELTTTAGGSPTQSTTSDAEGGFSFSLAGSAYGDETIYVRTVRYDANTGQAFTSDWTTAGISPLTFNYVQTPSLSSVSEVYAAGTSTLEVVGQVSPTAAMNQIVVEFGAEGDGTVDYSENVNAEGTFAPYEPYNFDPGQQQMQVRVGDELAPGAAIWSNWQAGAAPTQSPVYTVNISQLALSNTAADFNGASSNCSLAGQISGAGNLGGYTVEFDTNGDGTVEGSAQTAADGSFQFSPQNISYGLVTIAARVAQDTSSGSSYGGWTYLRFYYTVTPDSSESQTVVAALNQEDPTWQSDATGLPDSGLTSHDVQDAGQTASDEATQEMQALQNGMSGAAAASSTSAPSTPQSAYDAQIAAAAAEYATEISSYTGDATTESIAEFAWPDAPADNAAVVSAGLAMADRPSSPA